MWPQKLATTSFFWKRVKSKALTGKSGLQNCIRFCCFCSDTATVAKLQMCVSYPSRSVWFPCSACRHTPATEYRRTIFMRNQVFLNVTSMQQAKLIRQQGKGWELDLKSFNPQTEALPLGQYPSIVLSSFQLSTIDAAHVQKWWKTLEVKRSKLGKFAHQVLKII